MRARHVLPAALALAVLVVGSGCGNGSGLRVEGADPDASSATPVMTPKGFGPSQSPARKTPSAVPESTMTLPEVRDSLQADKGLDPYMKKIVGSCSAVALCLTRGLSVDVMKTGTPQLVVLIHTNDNFVFGAVLMADSPKGPRRVWSLKADQLKISPSPQGDLVVESQVFTLDDLSCCPSGRLVEVYRWAGGKMTKVSSKNQKGD
ncbi:hypothetical protein OHA70_21830 [Kribbella sp. NBC_00382]|uniref:hypothetical protein n=1 Tax=Kribbella sp. NBC_00382 TaxID=2975967 RepID=UPI002E1DE3EA